MVECIDTVQQESTAVFPMYRNEHNSTKSCFAVAAIGLHSFNSVRPTDFMPDKRNLAFTKTKACKQMLESSHCNSIPQ